MVNMMITDETTEKAVLKVKAMKEREVLSKGPKRNCSKLVRKLRKLQKNCSVKTVNDMDTINGRAQN